MKFYRIHNYRVIVDKENNIVGIFKYNPHMTDTNKVYRINRKCSLMALRNAIDRGRLERYLGDPMQADEAREALYEYDRIFWEGV